MATSGQFLVERPTVTAASAYLHQVNQDIQGQLTALHNKLQSVLSDPMVWRGDAQVAFAGVHERWNAATTKINQGIAEISQLLKTSESNYGESDAQSQSAISGAGSAL